MKRFIKHKRITVVGILILLLMMIWAPSCAEKRIRSQVHVDINSVLIDKVNLTQLNMIIDTEIENGNRIGFTVERVEFGIYFDENGEWIRLGEGDLSDLHLGAGKIANREVPVTIRNLQLVRLMIGTGLSALSDSEAPEIIVKGTAWVDVGPFTVKKHFTEIPARIIG